MWMWEPNFAIGCGRNGVGRGGWSWSPPLPTLQHPMASWKGATRQLLSTCAFCWWKTDSLLQCGAKWQWWYSIWKTSSLPHDILRQHHTRHGMEWSLTSLTSNQLAAQPMWKSQSRREGASWMPDQSRVWWLGILDMKLTTFLILSPRRSFNAAISFLRKVSDTRHCH